MKRLGLFEFEDQKWFPDLFRSAMTKILVVMNKMMGADKAVVKLLQPLLGLNKRQIVDLGSGAGGPMAEVVNELRQIEGLESTCLTLTDLYPNQDLVAEYQDHDFVSYEESTVDASKLNDAPGGIKTMINSFHHMSPRLARSILSSAKENKETILIYEMGVNNIPTLVWAVFLPLGLAIVFFMALVLTPMTRPLDWKQLLFTYLIPIIPICYAWDGQASLPRIYSSDDIDELLNGLETEDYMWTKGYGEGRNGKKVGNYILGQPII